MHHWPCADPRYVVVVAHGYGEHAGRYDHVAMALVHDGASVYAPDHAGHGESGGDRALVTSFDDLVADLKTVVTRAGDAHPGLPVVLIGHSMGGLIATRYAQLHGAGLGALVLSGPAIGDNPLLAALLELDPIPDVPIDPEILSRDPAVGEAYASDPLVYHGPFQRDTLRSFVTTIGEIAAGPALGDLPTLWIHGSDDALAPLDATREAVERIAGPRLEQKVYPGARHEIFNETNQDEVIGDVVAFIGRVV